MIIQPAHPTANPAWDATAAMHGGGGGNGGGVVIRQGHNAELYAIPLEIATSTSPPSVAPAAPESDESSLTAGPGLGSAVYTLFLPLPLRMPIGVPDIDVDGYVVDDNDGGGVGVRKTTAAAAAAAASAAASLGAIEEYAEILETQASGGNRAAAAVICLDDGGYVVEQGSSSSSSSTYSVVVDEGATIEGQHQPARSAVIYSMPLES